MFIIISFYKKEVAQKSKQSKPEFKKVNYSNSFRIISVIPVSSKCTEICLAADCKFITNIKLNIKVAIQIYENKSPTALKRI